MKLFAVLTISVFFCICPAFGQTPDGETPADEDVCDGQVGAAFGLCNAYCEAMDCDSAEPQASEKACSKVRDKYTQLAGFAPPCELVCPCWPEGLGQFLENWDWISGEYNWKVGPYCDESDFDESVYLYGRDGQHKYVLNVAAEQKDADTWMCFHRDDAEQSDVIITEIEHSDHDVHLKCMQDIYDALEGRCVLPTPPPPPS